MVYDIIVDILKVWKFFGQSFWSYFEVISRKLLIKSQNQNIFPYLKWILLSIKVPFHRYIVCWGKICRSKFIAPSHFRLSFWKIVYISNNVFLRNFQQTRPKVRTFRQTRPQVIPSWMKKKWRSENGDIADGTLWSSCSRGDKFESSG